MISVHLLECGPVATNAYVVVNPAIHQAFVVDTPPDSCAEILKVVNAKGCRLTDVLLTHTHWDHTADYAEIVKQTNAKVSVHAEDAYRLLDPMRHTVWQLPFTIPAVVPDVLLENDDRITASGVALVVRHTPGHTEGGVCFIDEVNKRVFVGDTLFSGSIGRTDLPGGNMEKLLFSIVNELLVLDDAITVLPGHGQTTTIGHERLTNPFLS